MIHSIRGIIQSVTQSYVIIDMHGLSWLIYATTTTLELLAKKESEEASVYTWLQVTDNAMILYGFADIRERDVFLALISVSGIGAKGAIKILSNGHFSSIITHIKEKDIPMLMKTAKVSQKKAQSILLKLEGISIASYRDNETSTGNGGTTHQLREQVIEGLMEMGYTRKQIEDALRNTIDMQKIDLHAENLSGILKALIVYLQKGVFTL